MVSPLTQAALSERSQNPQILEDEQGGWYFPDGSLRAYFAGLEDTWPSKEIMLKDLGRFPLPDTDSSLLKKTLKDDNVGGKMSVPDLLKKSNIPIFFAEQGAGVVYLPAASLPICRYFSQAWSAESFQSMVPEGWSEEDGDALAGLFILNSFVGAG